MSLQDSKNSYGAVDLEQGSQKLDTKDAVADGTSRPAQQSIFKRSRIVTNRPRRFAIIATVAYSARSAS